MIRQHKASEIGQNQRQDVRHVPIGNKTSFQLWHDPYIISTEVVKKVFPIGHVLEFLLSPFFE